MKFASVLAIAVTVALASSVDHASAASTCTQNDAKKILSLSGEVLSDKNCLDATTSGSECPNAKCYALLEKVTSEMPNCVADGKNPQEIYQKMLADCKKSSTGTSSTSTTSAPSPTDTTTSSSSTPSATTANAKSPAAGRSVTASTVVALSSVAVAAIMSLA